MALKEELTYLSESKSTEYPVAQKVTLESVQAWKSKRQTMSGQPGRILAMRQIADVCPPQVQDFLNREDRFTNFSTLVGACTVRVSLGGRS